MVAIIDSRNVKLCVILLMQMKNLCFARDHLPKEMKAEHILVIQKVIISFEKDKSIKDYVLVFPLTMLQYMKKFFSSIVTIIERLSPGTCNFLLDSAELRRILQSPNLKSGDR